VDIEWRELAVAIRCYTSSSSWEPIQPFVDSYVDTLAGLHPAVRAQYLTRPLAEIVWETLYGLSQIQNAASATATFPQWLAENRAAIRATKAADYTRKVRLAFGRAVRNVASTLPEFATVSSADEFIDYLWNHPDWCPAARLSFEVSQRFQADITTTGRASDVEDLVRMKAVPYVNVFVADASKRAYLAALRSGTKSRLRKCAYWATCDVVANLDEAIASG
jgi:hypothetical protein